MASSSTGKGGVVGEELGERDLRGPAPFVLGHRLHRSGDVEMSGDVLVLKATIGPAQRSGPGLAEADMGDLVLLYDAGQGLHRLRDRAARLDAVDLVEVRSA